MNWYKNISVKSKFGIMLTVTGLLVIILGLFSAGELDKANRGIKSEVSSNRDITVSIMESIQDVINIRFTAFQIEFSHLNQGNYDGARDELTKSYEIAKQSLNDYIEIVTEFSQVSEKDRNELLSNANKTLELLKKYYEGNIVYVDLLEQGRNDEATEQDNSTTPIAEELFNVAYNLPSIAFSNLISDLDKNSQDMSFRARSILVITLIVVIILSIFAFTLARSIRKPIEKIKNAAHQVLAGDLNVDIRTNNKDELGDLSNTIANMSGTIQCIIDDINALSEAIRIRKY